MHNNEEVGISSSFADFFVRIAKLTSGGKVGDCRV